MAEKNAERLASLFDDQAKFVHMSGTWKTAQELEIIKTGTIPLDFTVPSSSLHTAQGP
jgi:hypothetical protein